MLFWFSAATMPDQRFGRENIHYNSFAWMLIVCNAFNISVEVTPWHSILKIFSQSSKSTFHLCIWGNWMKRVWMSFISCLSFMEVRKIRICFCILGHFCCESFRYRMFCFLFRARRYINKSFYKIIFDERPYCLWRNVWSGRPIGILLMCSRMGTFACCLLCILIINIILTENYLKSGDYWGFIFAIAFNWQLSFLFLHNSRHIWICNIYLCEYLC